jgi:hypothetical protein
MGVIKLGIISLLFFALLITGISLFIPSHVRISKATDINANREVVLAQLNNPVNWKAWYPGADSSDYFMVDGKIKGITTGDLQGLIINEASDSTISTVNAGPNSRKGESGWNIFNGRTPNTVTVQWYMDIHLRWYPWDKFSSLLLEKRYGPMMELGLDKLKKLLEKEDKL